MVLFVANRSEESMVKLLLCRNQAQPGRLLNAAGGSSKHGPSPPARYRHVIQERLRLQEAAIWQPPTEYHSIKLMKKMKAIEELHAFMIAVLSSHALLVLVHLRSPNHSYFGIPHSF